VSDRRTPPARSRRAPHQRLRRLRCGARPARRPQAAAHREQLGGCPPAPDAGGARACVRSAQPLYGALRGALRGAALPGHAGPQPAHPAHRPQERGAAPWAPTTPRSPSRSPGSAAPTCARAISTRPALCSNARAPCWTGRSASRTPPPASRSSASASSSSRAGGPRRRCPFWSAASLGNAELEPEIDVTLADALWQANTARPRALSLAEQARARYERLGDGPRQARAARWLAGHPL
jgi:hypothetical protein